LIETSSAGYIRKKAVELFQVNQTGTAPELPLVMIEGVDEIRRCSRSTSATRSSPHASSACGG